MSRTNPSLSGVFSYNAQSLLSTTCLENRCLEQIPLWGVFSYNAQSLLSTTCLENRCLEQIPLWGVLL